MGEPGSKPGLLPHRGCDCSEHLPSESAALGQGCVLGQGCLLAGGREGCDVGVAAGGAQPPLPRNRCFLQALVFASLGTHSFPIAPCPQEGPTAIALAWLSGMLTPLDLAQSP